MKYPCGAQLASTCCTTSPAMSTKSVGSAAQAGPPPVPVLNATSPPAPPLPGVVVVAPPVPAPPMPAVDPPPVVVAACPGSIVTDPHPTAIAAAQPSQSRARLMSVLERGAGAP